MIWSGDRRVRRGAGWLSGIAFFLLLAGTDHLSDPFNCPGHRMGGRWGQVGRSAVLS
jgi:hypothetical protein